jgi:hypothetical protein
MYDILLAITARGVILARDIIANALCPLMALTGRRFVNQIQTQTQAKPM